MVAPEGQLAIRLTLDTVSDPSHQRTRQQPEEGRSLAQLGSKSQAFPLQP